MTLENFAKGNLPKEKKSKQGKKPKESNFIFRKIPDKQKPERIKSFVKENFLPQKKKEGKKSNFIFRENSITENSKKKTKKEKSERFIFPEKIKQEKKDSPAKSIFFPKPPLKILHVINHFYPCKGGMEEVALNLAKQAIEEKNIVEVFCLNTCSGNKQKLKDEEINGIKIHRFPFLNLHFYKLAFFNPSRLKNYDIIFLHGLSFFSDFILSNKPKKTKVFFITHGGIFHTKTISPLKNLYFKTISKNLLKKADGIIAVSNQDKETFSRIYQKEIKLIENGIDFSRFSGISASKKDKYSFIALGRLAKNKQIDKLILLFNLLVQQDKRYTLHIIGPDSDNLRPSLENLIKEKNLSQNIFLHGSLDDSEIRNLFSKSLYYISASSYEGFGITAIESMSAYCIPILNNIPTFKKLIEENNCGLLIDVNNLEETKNQILANNKILLPNLSSKAIQNNKISKKWNWENIYKQYDSYIRSFLSPSTTENSKEK